MSATHTIGISTSISESKARIWTGRILTALVALFLLFDGIMKVIKERHVLQSAATRLFDRVNGRDRHTSVGLYARVRNSAHCRSRRSPVDGLSGRRGCNAGAGGQSGVRMHFPGHLWRARVGGSVSARSAP